MSGRFLVGQSCLVVAISFIASSLIPIPAFGDDGAIDLIGRGKTFTVVERDGDVREVPEASLTVQDGTHRSYVDLDKVPTAEDEGGETAEAAEGATQAEEPAGEEGKVAPDGTEPAGEPAAKPAEEPKQETPEEKAAREKDVRALRAMIEQGGAYFYDENNKPLSYQQVSAMVREGNVEDIHAEGLHLSSWSSSLGKLEKDGKKTSASSSKSAASETPKRSVHENVAEGEPFRKSVQDNKPFDVKQYNSGTPEDGQISPLAVPEDRRPFREVLKEDKREPFNPKDDYTKNY